MDDATVGDPTTTSNIIQQLYDSRQLAFQPDLRLKASWNLASILLDTLNSNYDVNSSSYIDQRDEVISAWKDVLDLAWIGPKTRSEVENILASLSPPSRPRSTPLLPPPLSSRRHQSSAMLNLASILRKDHTFTIETLTLQQFVEIGELLQCMVHAVDDDDDDDDDNPASLLVDICETRVANDSKDSSSATTTPTTTTTTTTTTTSAADWSNILQFSRIIARGIVRPHRRRAARTSHAPTVAVVGGGPTGLSTAIVAWTEGAASVIVYEKRGMPVRQHWFDANPTTMLLLDQWGLNMLDVRSETEQDMPGYATFQCHVLERFLGLIAMASGVTIRRHVVAKGVEQVDGGHHYALILHSAAAAAAAASSSPFLPRQKFDVLYVCDGANSNIRASMKEIVSSSYQRIVAPLPYSRSLEIEPLSETNEPISQSTLILAFQQDKNGRCPDYDQSQSPFESALLDGSDRRITAVFKRLFPPFCECQLLFSHDAFANETLTLKLDQGYVDAAIIPWNLILKHLNHIFTVKWTSVESLKESLLPYVYNNNSSSSSSNSNSSSNSSSQRGGSSSVQKHAVLFRMGILKTEHAAYALPPPLLPAAPLPKRRGSIVVFRGDALCSAHYRLGIGINQALESLDLEVTALMKQMMYRKTRSSTTENEVDAAELVSLARERAASRVAWMVHVQLFTMMFEAFCDTIVDNSDLNRLTVLKKDFQAKAISAKPLGEADILSLDCMRRFRQVKSGGIAGVLK